MDWQETQVEPVLWSYLRLTNWANPRSRHLADELAMGLKWRYSKLHPCYLVFDHVHGSTIHSIQNHENWHEGGLLSKSVVPWKVWPPHRGSEDSQGRTPSLPVHHDGEACMSCGSPHLGPINAINATLPPNDGLHDDLCWSFQTESR